MSFELIEKYRISVHLHYINIEYNIYSLVWFHFLTLSNTHTYVDRKKAKVIDSCLLTRANQTSSGFLWFFFL
jgi:hypothetical protein